MGLQDILDGTTLTVSKSLIFGASDEDKNLVLLMKINVWCLCLILGASDED